MCTISWRISSEGFDVFFNRDESKTRVLALKPSVNYDFGVNAIYPLDPQGGGTWLAANDAGLVVGLLNFYQGRLPKGRLISRGQLVKRLAFCQSLTDVKDIVNALPLEKYAPFSLLCFDVAMLNSVTMVVPLLRWTGKELIELSQRSPLISSAYKFEEVEQSRLKSYQECFHSGGQPVPLKTYIDFHKSHVPEASAYSVCMHRSDAHTVSFSHVSVTQTSVCFRYVDGAPCSQSNVDELVLSRVGVAV